MTPQTMPDSPDPSPDAPPARAPEPARPALPEATTTLVIHVRPGGSVASDDDLVLERRTPQGMWTRSMHGAVWQAPTFARRIECAVDLYGESNVRVVRITTHRVSQVLSHTEAIAHEPLIANPRA